MHLARVKGNVVASHKAEGLEGEKFMLIQPLDENLKPEGNVVVAVDTVQAGQGDLVTVVVGLEAMFATGKSMIPVDFAIIGQVDEVVKEV